jgi:hypothetical protein
MTAPKDDYLIRPDPLDPRLTERVSGVDQTGQAIETRVTVERALTIFLNSQEIVTAMTINDYPEYLALGYLLNQHMLLPDDVVTGVDYDEELAVVVLKRVLGFFQGFLALFGLFFQTLLAMFSALFKGLSFIVSKSPGLGSCGCGPLLTLL